MIGNLPSEIYTLYLDGQLNLTSLALLESTSSSRSAADRYLEREELEGNNDVDDVLENLSIIGRTCIDYVSELLASRLKEVGAMLSTATNEVYSILYSLHIATILHIVREAVHSVPIHHIFHFQ